MISRLGSGKHDCLVAQSPTHASRWQPPCSLSRLAAKTLGESNADGAVPVDRAIGAYERSGAQIADHHAAHDRQTGTRLDYGLISRYR